MFKIQKQSFAVVLQNTFIKNFVSMLESLLSGVSVLGQACNRIKKKAGILGGL